jgi:predicted GIY-YIG superfamily endonuclease
MTTNVYVLKLQGGNYYVGKSDDVIGRFQEHMSGNGSAWTRKHKPISIVESRDGVSVFEEDKVTKEYMAKYGIDKVRGGSYVMEELSEFHKEALNMEIWTAKDCCTQCGRKGHFVKDCHASTDISGNKIVYEEPKIELIYVNNNKRNKNKCYRCGREGHYSNMCYAKSHIKGYELDSDSESESDWDSDWESK